jgi:hypothetical protein
VSPVETSGEWRDERLYVLKTLEEMRLEQRRQADSAAVLSQSQMVKADRDIQAAHNKIRTLESAGSALKMKNWIMTSVFSVIVMLLFELVKWYLVQHK